MTAADDAKMAEALRRQLQSFTVRSGYTYAEFIALWQAGRLPDTAENASLSIEAYALRQGAQKLWGEDA